MSDTIAIALKQAPATPAGRQAAWYLGRLHAQGQGASLSDKAHFGPTLPEAFGPPGAETRGVYVDPIYF
jgi:hypothetical protein